MVVIRIVALTSAVIVFRGGRICVMLPLVHDLQMPRLFLSSL